MSFLCPLRPIFGPEYSAPYLRPEGAPGHARVRESSLDADVAGLGVNLIALDGRGGVGRLGQGAL